MSLPELQHKPRLQRQPSSPTPAGKSKSVRCQRPAGLLLYGLTKEAFNVAFQKSLEDSEWKIKGAIGVVFKLRNFDEKTLKAPINGFPY